MTSKFLQHNVANYAEALDKLDIDYEEWSDNSNNSELRFCVDDLSEEQLAQLELTAYKSYDYIIVWN